MAITVTFQSLTTVAEEIANNADSLASNAKTVTHSAFNTAATLNAGSTPPATLNAQFVQALSNGAATIDLTTLTGTNGKVVSGSGLKVQVLKLKAKGTNANVITAAKGASNGYELAGAAWSVALMPGQEVTFFGNDATPDIAAGAKTIDLAGTGTQSLEVVVIMG